MALDFSWEHLLVQVWTITLGSLNKLEVFINKIRLYIEARIQKVLMQEAPFGTSAIYSTKDLVLDTVRAGVGFQF